MDTTLGKTILITREVPEVALASLWTLVSSRWSSNIVHHQLMYLHVCVVISRRDSVRSGSLVGNSRTDNPSRVSLEFALLMGKACCVERNSITHTSSMIPGFSLTVGLKGAASYSNVDTSCST